MDLMRSWVDIEVEKVSVCVICAVRTVKVWVTLWNFPVYSERRALLIIIYIYRAHLSNDKRKKT